MLPSMYPASPVLLKQKAVNENHVNVIESEVVRLGAIPLLFVKVEELRVQDPSLFCI